MINLKERFENSYFVVNKLYLIFIFILLILEDFSLGFYYFLFGIIFFSLHTLSSKLPIEVDGNFEEETYIYKKTDDKELKLDLWLADKENKKHPLVFFCHGGGWISGFRNQPNNVSWCKFLATKGFAVISIDYRYGYRNTMEEILADYTDALKYVRDNSDKLRIDKDNIVLMGLSAGAHLSLLYSSYYSYVKNAEYMRGIKSVVSYYGPADLTDIFIDDNKSLFAKFALKTTMDNENEVVEKLYSKEEIYYFYSPIKWITENMIPTFLAHGVKDKTVPYITSVKLAKKLNDNHIPYTFVSHPDADHSFDTKLKDEKTIEILNKTVDYISKSIKNNKDD